jgi:hypothetical protein
VPAAPQRDGCLNPWAHPVTGDAGWQVITRPRHLALAIAARYGGTACRHTEGEWQAQIPQPVLVIVVIAIDARMLRCRLGAAPELGIFSAAFAAWPAATAPEGWPADLPAQGRLSVRDIRVTTRMGRTVRYMVPELRTP